MISVFLQCEAFKIASERGLLSGMLLKDEIPLSQILYQAYQDCYGKSFLAGVKNKFNIQASILSIIKDYNILTFGMMQHIIRIHGESIATCIAESALNSKTKLEEKKRSKSSNAVENLYQEVDFVSFNPKLQKSQNNSKNNSKANSKNASPRKGKPHYFSSLIN